MLVRLISKQARDLLMGDVVLNPYPGRSRDTVRATIRYDSGGMRYMAVSFVGRPAGEKIDLDALVLVEEVDAQEE